MKEWKNPEVWALGIESTEATHDGDNFDGVIVNTPCGRFGMLES